MIIRIVVLVFSMALLSTCDTGTSHVDKSVQPPGGVEPVDPDEYPNDTLLATYSVSIQSIQQIPAAFESYTVRILYRYDRDPQTTLIRPQRPSELHVELSIVTNARGEIETLVVVDEIELPERFAYRTIEVTLSRSQFLQDVVVSAVKSYE